MMASLNVMGNAYVALPCPVCMKPLAIDYTVTIEATNKPVAVDSISCKVTITDACWADLRAHYLTHGQHDGEPIAA